MGNIRRVCIHVFWPLGLWGLWGPTCYCIAFDSNFLLTVKKETRKMNNTQLAVLQFRGMAPQERTEVLNRVLYEANNHPDRDKRAGAKQLLPVLQRTMEQIRQEQTDMEERIRRQVLASVPAQTRTQTYEYTPPNPERAAELQRGFFAVGVLVVGVGLAVSVIRLLIESGLIPLILGVGFVLFLLSALFSGGSARADNEATATQGGTQSIHINITGNGGQIHVQQ